MLLDIAMVARSQYYVMSAYGMRDLICARIDWLVLALMGRVFLPDSRYQRN